MTRQSGASAIKSANFSKPIVPKCRSAIRAAPSEASLRELL
jgi:hypothetical protein